MSLEADLLLLGLPDEDPPLTDTLIIALQRIQLIHVQTSDPQKLGDNKHVLL